MSLEFILTFMVIAIVASLIFQVVMANYHRNHAALFKIYSGMWKVATWIMHGWLLLAFVLLAVRLVMITLGSCR